MVRTRLVVLVAVAALVMVVLVVVRPGEWLGGGEDGAELSGVSSVTVTGRGYGHGRGLSQWGAQGAARDAGKNYREIVDFYYPGTDWGRKGGRIKVLLTDATRPVLKVRHRSHLKAVAVGTWQQWPLEREGAQRWRLKPVANGTVTRISVWTDGSWRKFRDVPGAVQFKAGGRKMDMRVNGTWRSYRGKLRLARPGSAADITNVVAIETYLRGVVPREVPALWHPQAVRAQAVAARTYAHYEKAHPRGGHFHVYDTVASQVYGGADAEHPASDDAIRATRRQILRHDGEPAFTQFSASNGGWTVHGSEPYQTAQQDPWDRWDGNPHRWWRVTLQAAAIERAYPAVGDFRRLAIWSSWRDGNGQWGGRVLKIRIVGSAGKVTVSGSDFRFALGLKSTWFKVE